MIVITEIGRRVRFLIILVICSTCITEFVPEINESEELLVVEGLITDQPEMHTIRISRSLPVNQTGETRPLAGCIVIVSDDMDNRTRFDEAGSGIYISPPGFHGEIGRSYKVHITVPAGGAATRTYDSKLAEMLPVFPIDDLYYEKILVRDTDNELFDVEECRIFLDTYADNNTFIRWEYFETWIFRLLFSVPNQTCWVSDHSRDIMIKNTAALGETEIRRQPVVYISNNTDRLSRKYSILVNQYSMSEEEYNFWAALRALSEESGGPYDRIPASVPGNITCNEDPGETVLGYFSVSAKSSKRLFIDEKFAGIIDRYDNCIADTIYGNGPIPGLDTNKWVLFDIPRSFPRPRTRILTNDHGCYDCTDRGTTEKPSFWIDD